MHGLALTGEGASANMETVTNAVTTAMSNVQSNAMSLVAAAIPYALGIAGVVLVVGIGWKVFKRFTK